MKKMSPVLLLLLVVLSQLPVFAQTSKKSTTWEDTLLVSNSYIDYSTPSKHLEQGELTAL